MRLKSITSVKNLKGKRVLVRIDANVPIIKGKVVDGPSGRIAQTAESLRWLRKQKARLILITHLGRPKGKNDKSASLAPVAKHLSRLLKTKVQYDGSLAGPKAQKLLEGVKDGEVALLENLRFDPREEKNDKAFAKELASLADIYINDGFGVSHRAHASVAAIQKLLPSYAGPLLVKEVEHLSNAMDKPKRPFVLVLGGAKMETKVGLLEKLGPKADVICIGGALANTFLAAEGWDMGKSLYEKDALKTAARILKRFGQKILLPVDGRGKKNATLDIGPVTVAMFTDVIAAGKTIVWNGPLGWSESKQFVKGTQAIAKAIAKNTKAETVVGGGDTVPIVEDLHLAKKFSLVSTGGGAMLAFLAGEKLPGVQPLII